MPTSASKLLRRALDASKREIRADLGMQSNHPIAEVVANRGHIVPALSSCVGGALTVQLLPSLDVLI